MTGFAANVKGAAQSATDFSAYNTETGYLASTTGNITGIYDISGGAWEYVAGYKDTYLGSSGFTEEELTTYANYLDVYPSDSTRTTYNYRILGDATGELGPFYNAGSYVNNWYNGLSVFLFGTNSWFLRGGGVRNGSSAGPFYFNSLAGGANADRGFRIILAF